MLTNATAPRLMTVDEVADRLRVNRATAYRLIRDQELPAFRFGAHGHFRIRESDLEQWLEDRRTAL
jgi:excisionase family DNA binding protein